MTARLQVRGLSKRFAGGALALDNVSFDLAAGEVLALVGESGSGKSTLARALAGLVPAETRGVTLDGEPLARRGTRLQLVFQDPFASLNPVHTVEHHLARPLANRAPAVLDARGEIARLLAAVGLEPALAARRPHELSGGQRQRVAIARALAAAPDVILADEPTSMLDVSTRLGVLTLLRRLADQQRLAILLITHDLPSAAAVADRVLTLYAGRIVESGATRTVLRAPAHPYTRLLLAAAPRGERLVPPAASATSAPDATLVSRAPDATLVSHAPDATPSPGCAFAPRCPHLQPRCLSTPPREQLIAGDHRVCCYLYAKGASDHAALS